MDNFCGSKFWNWNLTWNTESPRFNHVSKKLFLFGSLIVLSYSLFQDQTYVYFCSRNKIKNISWGWMNISKMVGIVLLLCLTFLDITYAVVWHPSNLNMHAVDYRNGIIKLLAFSFAGILVILHKKRGIRTSCTLFIFWFLFKWSVLYLYLTEISFALNNKNTLRLYPYISNVIYFPTTIFLLIQELSVDGPPLFSKLLPLKNHPPIPDHLLFVISTLAGSIRMLFVFIRNRCSSVICVGFKLRKQTE